MKKIMFNDKFGLTQAVLEGRKTMTRRICKYNRPDKTYDIVFPVFESKDYDNECNIISSLDGAFGWRNDKGDFTGWNIPKYKVGEVVAIAQSYKDCGNFPNDLDYDEDGYPIMPKNSGYFNKMFVRGDLMPHHIRITDVKVERLNDITPDDCLKEGISYDGLDFDEYGDPQFSFYGSFSYTCAKDAFAALIDKVSGKGTWESNPYLFAYEFELVD